MSVGEFTKTSTSMTLSLSGPFTRPVASFTGPELVTGRASTLATYSVNNSVLEHGGHFGCKQS